MTLESGPEDGRPTMLALGGAGLEPDIEPGDEVRVARSADPALPGVLEGLLLAGIVIAALGVLAYVGASLPLLLIFSSGELGVLDAVNTELIAKEVIGTLVGSIGLIAAVPVTTALAALVARDLPVGAAAETS